LTWRFGRCRFLLPSPASHGGRDAEKTNGDAVGVFDRSAHRRRPAVGAGAKEILGIAEVVAGSADTTNFNGDRRPGRKQ